MYFAEKLSRKFIAVMSKVPYIRGSIPVILTLSLKMSRRYSIPAFITKVNNPNVSMIIGDNISFTRGLI